MALLTKLLAFGGPAALAVMGFVVVITPPISRVSKVVWFGGFLIVALFSVIAEVRDADNSESRLSEMLLGGDHFCYYRADPADLEKSKQVPLWINCDGPIYNLSVWFSPSDATDPNDPRYWSLGGQHFAETVKGGVRAGVVVTEGKYRIEMSARNGTVIELLDIKNANEKLVQTFELFRHPGGKFYSE